ncbi:hypothetical protein Ddye_006065 [Dipteronia dyeriana]|uniref:Pectate lyase superfamily protein domain-containing protein n=1 Tax=Dipteronia dyeriana TaxID=168575 RepID=A0AAE0CQA1_9ROSI|nr:hypothetical protein Ddye_006065 [Dipteronia dyeriana]
MKPILALCSILCSLLLRDSYSTSSTRQKKQQEFQAKLQDNIAPSILKRDGSVFYPIGYGADPTGVRESSDAILQAVSDAFNVESELEMLAGVKDLGGVILDLQGGTYKISKPIRFPASAAANLLVQGGTLRASETFPGDRHLIELWSPNSQKQQKSNSTKPIIFTHTKLQNVGIYYEDITFRDILFGFG